MFIVFLGVDGSGKTTMVDGLTEWLKKEMPKTKINYFHFCPTKRYNKKGSIAVTNPHALPTYNIPINIIKDIFILWNFFVGGRKVKKLLKKGETVIIDRYYYDLLIDPLRYRLLNLTYRKYLIKSVLEPDGVFYCIGDSSQIYQRKKETSIEDIIIQQNRILQVVNLMNSERARWVEVNTTKNDKNSSLNIIKINIMKILRSREG